MSVQTKMDEGMVEIEDEDGKDAAAEAKARGTALFAKGRDESYREAILAYEEVLCPPHDAL